MPIFAAVLIFAGLVALLYVVVALPGYLINRRRHADTLRAVPDTLPHIAVRHYRATHRAEDDAQIPLGGPERDTWEAVQRYEAVVNAAADPHLEVITDALAAFMTKHQIELPEVNPVGPADCGPWVAVDLALLRLRVGIHEPFWAERTCTTDTGMFSTAELNALLDAEDALVPA